MVSEHHIEDLKEQQKQIYELTISVKELALSVRNMVTEQKSQSDRIRKLEEEPADNWNGMKKAALTAIVSTVSGALAAGVIILIANYI